MFHFILYGIQVVNLLAYSSCSSNSRAHVERPFYPKHMKSEETPPLAGESPPKATPNPLTFSWDSDGM
jgi:hypothetical protein